MSRTGTRARTLAVAVSLFAGAVGLVPPASAAAGPLAGTWASVDVDGSNQTLKVKGAGNPVYAIVLRDDFTSGVCGGPPAKLVGHGAADGAELFMRGTLVCLHGGNPPPGHASASPSCTTRAPTRSPTTRGSSGSAPAEPARYSGVTSGCSSGGVGSVSGPGAGSPEGTTSGSG